MFSRGDIVLLYLFDVNYTIGALKKFNRSRFGKVKDINQIEVGNKVYNEYTVELFDKNVVTVKEYMNTFKICNMTELQGAILESDKLTDKEKDDLINEVQDVLQSAKAK